MHKVLLWDGRCCEFCKRARVLNMLFLYVAALPSAHLFLTKKLAQLSTDTTEESEARCQKWVHDVKQQRHQVPARQYETTSVVPSEVIRSIVIILLREPRIL